jgi:crotonobetainyl-CoA:carnitine CoA-transferase CaiB-like acyl-CoA transferase
MSANPHPNLPLAGLKVLDLSRILAGPFCCQILADLGADVVKVERPGSGDDTRTWGPPFAADGTSAYYLSANRGKRSLALDLSDSSGREVLSDLLRTADVLVENFLPATSHKLGLEPARLAQLNPRLVSAAISGYGRTGPLAEIPGYDLVTQATSGLMAITGPPEGQPYKVGVAIADIVSGLFAAVGVLAGLISRARPDSPRACDVALFDCTLASLVNVAQNTLVTGQPPARWGNAHASIVPYEPFATADGHLVLAIGNDAQWTRFCRAVDCPAWAADPRFATNPERVAHRAEVVCHVATLLATRSSHDWQALFTAHDIPHAPVLTLDQALEQPIVAARQMIATPADALGHSQPILNGPIRWHDAPPPFPTPPPTLGQHTTQVLSDWLGYDSARIDQLRASGVIA